MESLGPENLRLRLTTRPSAEAGGFIEGLCLSHLRARAGQENLSLRGTATPIHQLQVARCYIRVWVHAVQLIRQVVASRQAITSVELQRTLQINRENTGRPSSSRRDIARLVRGRRTDLLLALAILWDARRQRRRRERVRRGTRRGGRGGRGSCRRRCRRVSTLENAPPSITEPIVDLESRKPRLLHELQLLAIGRIRACGMLEEPLGQHLRRLRRQLYALPLGLSLGGIDDHHRNRLPPL